MIPEIKRICQTCDNYGTDLNKYPCNDCYGKDFLPHWDWKQKKNKKGVIKND